MVMFATGRVAVAKYLACLNGHSALQHLHPTLQASSQFPAMCCTAAINQTNTAAAQTNASGNPIDDELLRLYEQGKLRKIRTISWDDDSVEPAHGL